MPDSTGRTGGKPVGIAAKCLCWATVALLTALACTGLARAHGVELIKEPCSTVEMRAFYSDGGPVSYAEVVIYAPDDPQRAFQRGRTDRAGRFAFCPDQKGSWRMVVNDGMGHQLTQKIEVEEAAVAVAAPSLPAAGLSLIWKILVGLCLIFGLFGLAAMVLASRRAPTRGVKEASCDHLTPVSPPPCGESDPPAEGKV